jgi:hypothetical protein
LQSLKRPWTTLSSVPPFAGQITARPVAVGEYVSRTSKLVTVVRSNPLKLLLQMPEAQRITHSPRAAGGRTRRSVSD